MPANTNPIFVLTPISTPVSFASGDTTAKKTLYTAGANGGRVDGISVCSDDSAAINMNFYVTIGGTDYYIGVVNIPIGSGYTTVVKVDALPVLVPASQNFLYLPAAAILKSACLVTMTAGRICTVVPFCGDF